MNREELDSRLLAFWQKEPLTEKECEEIEQWLQESEKHRCYYRELQKAFLRQRWVMREPLIRRKAERRYQAVARRRRIGRWGWMAAAAVCLLFLVGTWYFYRQSAEEVVSMAENEQILPGSAKAKLYLSSGEEVLLNQETQSIADQQVVIDVEQNGVLAYNGELSEWREKMIYNRLVVERGGEYKLVLSDGSEVWVNSATELEYPVRFAEDRRVVSLKGEAYFKVQADSARPFVVEVNGIEVCALGTEFNVNSYAEQQVKSVLVKGKISVGKEDERVIVKPSQLAVYDCVTGKTVVEEVDVRKYIDWKDGNFIFSEDRLEEVMEKISLWYDCDVIFVDRGLKEMRLSGNMLRYERVEKFLHYLEITTGARFEIQGKTILVKSK